jgi:hypothetical protein
MVSFLYTRNTENMTKNWDELCDEEKSFDAWFVQNNTDLYREIDDRIIGLLKIVYMKGYAAGFDAKGKHSAEEQLQK